MTPIDLQRQTLRLYGNLITRHHAWAGKLIFASGPACSATGLPAAVSIAGGTSLLVDPDAATVKAVLRQGGLDFVVNTLDEALRVLKNEIRKHTPLSVALICDVAPVLAEMTERGVLADLYVEITEAPTSGLEPPAVPAKQHLALTQHNGLVNPTEHLQRWLETRGWTEATLAAADRAELRSLDVRLIQMLGFSDNLRLQWLRRIPHYQRPDPAAGRAAWLTSAEAQDLQRDAPT